LASHCAIVPPCLARSCTRSVPLSLLLVRAPFPRPLSVPHRWLLLWRLLNHPQQARPGHSDPLFDGFPPRRQDPRAEEPAGPLLRCEQGLIKGQCTVLFAKLSLCNSNRIILAWARRRWHSFEAGADSIGLIPGGLWKCAIENSRAPEAGPMAVPACIHLKVARSGLASVQATEIIL